MVYFVYMNLKETPFVDLTKMRENAGLTVRGLASQLGISHVAILKWEKVGKVTKTEFLIPMASILGVTIDELIGRPEPRKSAAPGGKLGQVFREVSELPRSQQNRIISFVEDMLTAQKSKA
jgi:transcriptional regulator with XRE-family HTH domain